MLQTITLKLRLYMNHSTDSEALNKLSHQYMLACNDISTQYFKSYESLSRSKMQKLYYRHLRATYGLKSQEAQSVFRTIFGQYRAVNTQYKSKPYTYRDEYTKQWHHGYEDVHWIWNPICFHRPQADLVADRDWRFSKDMKHVTISVLSGHLKLRCYLPRYFKKYLKYNHKFGTAKLLHNANHWWLHIGCTVSVPDYDYHKQTHNTAGIDRGWRFLATTYDNHKHSQFYSGLKARHIRKHYLYLRKVLQSKCSKSAKKHLKRMHEQENRWMSNVNHCISKALVQSYGKHTTFTLEDLRNIRWTLCRMPKKERGVQVSWAFYELGMYLTYKATLNQSKVIHINAHYTSQRCPCCGHVLAESRRHGIHTYICKYCGYTSNDDRIGAMNIHWLGQQKVKGIKHPRIIPNQLDKPMEQISKRRIKRRRMKTHTR